MDEVKSIVENNGYEVDDYELVELKEVDGWLGKPKKSENGFILINSDEFDLNPRLMNGVTVDGERFEFSDVVDRKGTDLYILYVGKMK